MLKRPQHSKRRIAARLGPRADELASLLLGCAVEDLASWPGPVCLAPASGVDLGWAETLLAASVGRRYVVAQPGGNLGHRIRAVDGLLRTQGQKRIIMLGTDCPTLNDAYLMGATAALEHHDVVLGPASDGGVVLMGAARPWPDLASLPWSTPRLGADLDALCAARGLSVTRLPRRSDVDTARDLAGLGEALAHDARPARQALVAWLDDHGATLRALQ